MATGRGLNLPPRDQLLGSPTASGKSLKIKVPGAKEGPQGKLKDLLSQVTLEGATIPFSPLNGRLLLQSDAEAAKVAAGATGAAAAAGGGGTPLIPLAEGGQIFFSGGTFELSIQATIGVAMLMYVRRYPALGVPPQSSHEMRTMLVK